MQSFSLVVPLTIDLLEKNCWFYSVTKDLENPNADIERLFHPKIVIFCILIYVSLQTTPLCKLI